MSRPGREITLQTIKMSNKLKQMELKERSSKSLLANVLDIEDDFRHCNMNAGGNASNTNLNCAYLRSHQGHHQHGGTSSMTLPLDDTGCCSVAQRDLQLIVKEIQFITSRMRRTEEEAAVVSDWKFAAIVIDRFCLIVFTLFTIVATLVVLFSAPHIIVQ